MWCAPGKGYLSRKMNFVFSTKLGRGQPYQHVPEEYKAYCLLEPEKRPYKVQILQNVLFRKSGFKVFGECKDEKNSLSQQCLHQFSWNLSVICLKYTCTNPASSSKSVEQSANFEVFGGYKDEKNSYFSTSCTNLAEIWLWDVWNIRVLILQSSLKSVEQSVVFRWSIWWLQHFKKNFFVLQIFDPIRPEFGGYG